MEYRHPGAVSGTDSYFVAIIGGVIRGDVSVTGATVWAKVQSAEVRGDVTFAGNEGGTLQLATVRGSATLVDNGHAFVAANTIRVDLTCTNNGPDPAYDLDDTVGGVRNCPG